MQIKKLAVSAAIVAALAVDGCQSKEERAIRSLLSFFQWMRDNAVTKKEDGE